MRSMLSNRMRAIIIQKRNGHNFTKYLTDLESRGLLRSSYPTDVKNKFGKELCDLPDVAYAGFDPTAESLHVGNLLILTNLIRLGQYGIQPIALIGGATARIGDPSGRKNEREIMEERDIERNAKSVSLLIKEIMNRANMMADPIFVNNYDWFSKINMIKYLRNCKRMQLGEMLRMGAIKSRMESGISFTEFSYQTMQAYDWYKLSKEYNCYFQIGGSDQLGHLDFGAHYINRITNRFAAGVCLPLLLDSAGNKLGKSVGGGSMWLDSQKTSPYHFYQFFAQQHDDKAEELYYMLSLDSLDNINQIIASHKSNLGKWVAQKKLAEEMTRLVHGEEGLDMAIRCTEALFGGKTANLSKLNRDEIIQLFGTYLEIRKDDVSNYGEFADRTRSDKVKGSILMQKGAFSINGIKKTKPDLKLDWKDIIIPQTNDLTLICWGKRKYQLVKWL